jgi:uroporphyrinogen decarboxylase
MEEYRKLRSEFSFLELCKRPDLAAEITVTPVEKLGVDAAILFADILLILEPMGLGLEYSKDDGPVIRAQIRSRTDVEELNDFEPEKELPFVVEAVRKCRAALNEKVPLIGFAGAPFTLASYIVEGGGSRNYLKTKKLIYSDPGAWKALMERLARLVGK